ncbi:MAG: LytTR family DNA-binding domain-containing protein [Emcibacter sp.]|nr:LytTR family DNA-binding domain-containing protein [Emcibacter sp.]
MINKKVRTLLVDDEPLALRGLELRLAAYEDIEIIGSCANGREAIKKIRSERPDLVFLDIQMPGFDGFAVVKALAKEQMPVIIFATAFDQYAIKAFETHALDYLLKPIDEDRLQEAINKVRTAIQERITIEQNAKLINLIRTMDNPPTFELSEIMNAQTAAADNHYETHLHIKDRGQITRVDIAKIEWVEAAGDYMCLHAEGKTHILRETMKNMEKRLDPEIFQRVHRSTIINISQVTSLELMNGGKYQITLQSGAKLPVSRNYRDVIARFL